MPGEISASHRLMIPCCFTLEVPHAHVNGKTEEMRP